MCICGTLLYLVFIILLVYLVFLINLWFRIFITRVKWNVQVENSLAFYRWTHFPVFQRKIARLYLGYDRLSGNGSYSKTTDRKPLFFLLCFQLLFIPNLPYWPQGPLSFNTCSQGWLLSVTYLKFFEVKMQTLSKAIYIFKPYLQNKNEKFCPVYGNFKISSRLYASWFWHYGSVINFCFEHKRRAAKLPTEWFRFYLLPTHSVKINGDFKVSLFSQSMSLSEK